MNGSSYFTNNYPTRNKKYSSVFFYFLHSTKTSKKTVRSSSTESSFLKALEMQLNFDLYSVVNWQPFGAVLHLICNHFKHKLKKLNECIWMLETVES
jgi:hypothetical protein